MKKSVRSLVGLLLVLAIMISVLPMAFADTFISGVIGPEQQQVHAHSDINVIVTANVSLPLGESEDVYCQVNGFEPQCSITGNFSTEWNCSNPNVLRLTPAITNMDTEVTVTAVGVGTATVGCRVSATYDDGSRYTDYDYVTIEVGAGGSLTVRPWTKSLNVGEGFQLDVEGIGVGGTIRYFSNNEAVASVDSYGYVTARGAGNATITADWNGQRDACSVNVYAQQSNVITTLAPLTQKRTVAIGTSQNDIIRNFNDIYGYYRDSYGNSHTVYCPTTWTCTNSGGYNSNKLGTYEFIGNVVAPAGYTFGTVNQVTATVVVSDNYKLTFAPAKSTIAVGESITMNIKMVDPSGRPVSRVDGYPITVSLNASNGTVSFSDNYVTLNSEGQAAVRLTGMREGTSAITGEAWNTLSLLTGAGTYITVSKTTSVNMPFTDVVKTDWFYDDLATAYGMGLVNGKSKYLYKPNDNMSYAEAIKLAACMNQYYYNGKVTLENGPKDWYSTYVDYAKANGIPCAYSNMNAKVTREDFVNIFYHALPTTEFKAINSISSIPDVKQDNKFYDEIMTLFRAGVLTGNNGLFLPKSNIRRSEVATIIARMMKAENRRTFTM